VVYRDYKLGMAKTRGGRSSREGRGQREVKPVRLGKKWTRKWRLKEPLPGIGTGRT